MVWRSPERHGTMSAIMKAQIDWVLLSTGGVRPTLALAQICGSSQRFNAVNQMRILGRWMRMVTIPNQSLVPRAWDEFDQDLRVRPSPLYLRLVDVCEKLMKFTWITRARSAALTDRYSERTESELAGRGRHQPIWTLAISTLAIAAGILLLAADYGVTGAALVLYGGGNSLFSIARRALPRAVFGADRYPALMGSLARPSLIAQATAPLLGV